MHGFLPNQLPFLSVPAADPALRVISHGGGVQTSTLCLMAARGEIGPMPDLAIMADTGDEPREVYRHLDWLRGQVPFPIELVRRPGPSLSEMAIAVAQGERPRKGAPLPPWYIRTPAGDGMLPKQCSGEFKRDVVKRRVREVMAERGIAVRPGVVEMWIGMSVDELERVAVARRTYIHHRHPLVECRMTRRDCQRWAEDRQYRPAPKSACKYCPFRKKHQWRHLRDTAPEDFADAVLIDRMIRPGFEGMDGEAFVLRDCVPLDQANLDDESTDQLLLFVEDGGTRYLECDSCGV